MGFYDTDNSSLYRQNVLEIPWNKLDGVPENEDGNPAAIYQGTVQVRCFIHPSCPFMKVPREEYDLVFNELTVPVINNILPDYAKGALRTTFGVEGMHFLERYAYRHNYVFAQAIDDNNEASFEQVGLPDYDAVNNTRYQPEFSWVIRPSVFDYRLTDGTEITEDSTYFERFCRQKASWGYVYPNVSSYYTGYDELHDYKKDFYEANSSNFDSNNPGIDFNKVQVPRQTSAVDCLGGGAHWRVEKMTPLFRGEDFFIDFKRYASETNVKSGKDNQSQVYFDSGLSQYAPIDVYGDQWALPSIYTPTPPTTSTLGTIPEDSIFVNHAVRQSNELKDRLAYRLYDQAYYIIEIGSPTDYIPGDEAAGHEHYFIIITERAYPIFVTIDEIDILLHSRTLSTYDDEVGGVHGKAIINAEDFRVTVRNHLGKLVIYFDIKGVRQNPWVITKTRYEFLEDLVAAIDADGETVPQKAPITVPIVVPRAPISIWGGNLACGFSFGPLQYILPELEFRWPQKHYLPMDSKISARLTTSDEYIQDMARYQDAPGSPSSVVPLFTQQSHFYKQWGTSDQFSGLSSWAKGHFFFGQSHDPLIELSNKSVSGIRDSTVELSIYGDRVTYDEDRKRANFHLNVKMESGSQLFAESGVVEGWRDRATYVQPTTSNLSDDRWICESCKTPVVTGVRLVGEPNHNPRWADGTTAIGGYNGLPNSSSPNFRDVSHHVMSYTENWSANDFYELEHSGTIKFLLKPINVFVDDNGASETWDDTDYLSSLQNKNFYIEIWAGYEPLNDGPEYTQFGGFYKLMTGMCQGGIINQTVARQEMTCQVKDFKEVLKDQKFFNSPYFDGMKDVNAIFEILNMAGFRSNGAYDPGSIVRTLKDDNFSGPLYYTTGDGRFFISNPYALPSSYRRIEQAYYNFDVGTTLYDGIMKISKSSSKLFYFDQHGIAHFESYMDLIMQNLLGNNVLFDLFTFTSNPYGPSDVAGSPHQGQLIYNKLEWQWRQSDVHNHLKIISSTPNTELLIADDVRFESLDDPGAEGFIGYKKIFYQKEGMLGSEGAVNNLIDFYRVMFKPELYMKFETHGLPMRATDFITVDGQFLRVSKVSHDINAEKNTWWMNVEGERMQPIE